MRERKNRPAAGTRRALAGLAALAWFAASAAAQASTDFPGVIETELMLPHAPACALCHEAVDAGAGGGADAGAGAADTPFSRALITRGLLGSDAASLRAALARMRQDDVDSDGDGGRDLDELYWGTDPNTPDAPQGQPKAPPQYGCALSSGAPTGAAAAAVAGFGIVGLVAFGRRRRDTGGQGADPPS